MISITMMLIISTLQSSIDKMVPKTSYLKMVDVFLIYSFNIVIVIMGVHTYMDMCIHRDDITGLIVDSAASSRPSSTLYKITRLSVDRVKPIGPCDLVSPNFPFEDFVETGAMGLTLT